MIEKEWNSGEGGEETGEEQEGRACIFKERKTVGWERRGLVCEHIWGEKLGLWTVSTRELWAGERELTTLHCVSGVDVLVAAQKMIAWHNWFPLSLRFEVFDMQAFQLKILFSYLSEFIQKQDWLVGWLEHVVPKIFQGWLMFGLCNLFHLSAAEVSVSDFFSFLFFIRQQACHWFKGAERAHVNT